MPATTKEPSMKRLAIATLLFTPTLFAGTGKVMPMDDMTFTDAKAEYRRNLDMKISNLQSARGCVDNAADKTELRACRSRLDHNMMQAEEADDAAWGGRARKGY